MKYNERYKVILTVAHLREELVAIETDERPIKANKDLQIAFLVNAYTQKHQYSIDENIEHIRQCTRFSRVGESHSTVMSVCVHAQK